MDLFDKVASDLQSDITVGANNIGGTLKYVSGYTSAFTGSEANGNFLALHFEVPNVTGVTLKVKVIGGDHGETTLDPDGINIFRIKNTYQKIQVRAFKDGLDPVTKVYTLDGLILTPAS